MQGFEDNTHLESTIVNSVRRSNPEARQQTVGMNPSVGPVADRITLSEVAQGNSVCPNEEQQQAWLRANRGRGLTGNSNQAVFYRPPTLILHGSKASPYCMTALAAAAGRLG